MVVFKSFSKTSLWQSSEGRGPRIAAVRAVEAQYRNEFYRAFTSLLGYGVGISSEWSHDDSKGRVDFRILDPKWGVELLRNGTKETLKQHYERFLPNGRYYQWISDGSITDWLVIDCRVSTPTPGEYSKLASLLHLWVMPLIVISATWTETMVCRV